MGRSSESHIGCAFFEGRSPTNGCACSFFQEVELRRLPILIHLHDYKCVPTIILSFCPSMSLFRETKQRRVRREVLSSVQ